MPDYFEGLECAPDADELDAFLTQKAEEFREDTREWVKRGMKPEEA